MGGLRAINNNAFRTSKPVRYTMTKTAAMAQFYLRIDWAGGKSANLDLRRFAALY